MDARFLGVDGDHAPDTEDGPHTGDLSTHVDAPSIVN
jgi:hypothetical protein